MTAVAPRPRRRRNGRCKSLPTGPKKGSVTFPGAQRGPDVQGWTPSHFTAWLVDSPEYQETVGALCGKTWDALSEHSKSRRAYTPWKLESVEVLRRALGLTTTRKTRDFLAGDRGGGARRRLGFDQPTDHVHNRQRPSSGERKKTRCSTACPPKAHCPATATR